MVDVFYNNEDSDKVKVFFAIDENGVTSLTLGNHAVSKKSGIQFYVDDFVAVQLDKVNFKMEGLTPVLEVKDGEDIIIPEESEKEKEIKRLKRELERLSNAE